MLAIVPKKTFGSSKRWWKQRNIDFLCESTLLNSKWAK